MSRSIFVMMSGSAAAYSARSVSELSICGICHLNDVNACVLELILVLREILSALKVKGALANADLVARSAAGLLKRVVNAHASKLMLQVDDGLLVFPVGLNDHTLDGAPHDAEGVGLFLDNSETLLAL